MTFDEYIRNPLGKDNAVFSQRFMFRELYTQKFSNVMAREAGNIRYTLYKDNKKHYIMHIMIPSEVVPKFCYDVVVDFHTQDDITAAELTLQNYEVSFFSNDPAFVFTFAHAFKKAGMFCDKLSSKMSSRALKETGKAKNPEDMIGYVKSIYFAYLFYKMKGFDKKNRWYEAAPYRKDQLIKSIMHADQKIALREEKGRLITKARAKHVENTSSSPSRSVSHPVNRSNRITQTKRVNTTRTSSRVSVVKKK